MLPILTSILSNQNRVFNSAKSIDIYNFYKISPPFKLSVVSYLLFITVDVNVPWFCESLFTPWF